MVSNLFVVHADVAVQHRGGQVRKSNTVTRKYQAPTVSNKFQQSLLELVEKMERWETCVKTKNTKLFKSITYISCISNENEKRSLTRALKHISDATLFLSAVWSPITWRCYFKLPPWFCMHDPTLPLVFLHKSLCVQLPSETGCVWRRPHQQPAETLGGPGDHPDSQTGLSCQNALLCVPVQVQDVLEGITCYTERSNWFLWSPSFHYSCNH